MSKKDDALKLALEPVMSVYITKDGIEDWWHKLPEGRYELGDITAIREALAEQPALEHEPENEPWCSMHSKPATPEMNVAVDAALGIVREQPAQPQNPIEPIEFLSGFLTERLAIERGIEWSQAIHDLCNRAIEEEKLAEQPAQKRPQNCGTGYCSCIECLFEQPAQHASNAITWTPETGYVFKEQPAQQQEPVALDVTIDDEDALAALRDTVVQSNGDLTAIRLVVGNGHSGYGLYVANAEYQEEGALLLANTSPPATKPLTDDTKRLDALLENSWDLRCFDMPTGQGDADIGWRVIEHHMAKPQERTVAEVYCDDPRQAIDAAIEASHGITGEQK